MLNTGVLALVMVLLTGSAYAGKILVMHPIFVPSHILTLRFMAKALVARGHEVTVVRWQDTYQYPEVNYPGFTEHILAVNNSDGTIPHLTVEERSSFVLPQEVLWGKGTSWTAIPADLFVTTSFLCSNLFEKTELREELRGQKFDMAIVDLFINECGLALANDLGLPVVGYWAFTFSGLEPQYTTAFSPPSTVPIVLSHCSMVMNFRQRVWNHVVALISHIVMQVQFFVTNSQIQKYLPSSPSPSTMLANVSGMLINSHPAVDNKQYLPPSFIYVGGMQIRPPQSLPQDLEEFVEASGEAGLILFTMGFNFNSSVVHTSVIKTIMNVFKRLEQRVLVKLEMIYEDVPPNVKVVDWLPQQDILAHKKTVLFFTHCGMHGVLEALHYGVPMVGMPIFADQQDVLLRLEERGVAVGVHKQSGEEEILQAIKEVLHDKKYRENAVRLSKVLRDQLYSPLDHALWLIEHVITTKGADHLKTAARHLNLAQFFGLDVFAFFILLPYVWWRFVVPFFVRKLKMLTCGKKAKVE